MPLKRKNSMIAVTSTATQRPTDLLLRPPLTSWERFASYPAASSSSSASASSSSSGGISTSTKAVAPSTSSSDKIVSEWANRFSGLEHLLQAGGEEKNNSKKRKSVSALPPEEIYSVMPNWLETIYNRYSDELGHVSSSVSVFAQRSPAIYQEAVKFSQDILRLASWMEREYHDAMEFQEEQGMNNNNNNNNNSRSGNQQGKRKSSLSKQQQQRKTTIALQEEEEEQEDSYLAKVAGAVEAVSDDDDNDNNNNQQEEKKDQKPQQQEEEEQQVEKEASSNSNAINTISSSTSFSAAASLASASAASSSSPFSIVEPIFPPERVPAEMLRRASTLFILAMYMHSIPIVESNKQKIKDDKENNTSSSSNPFLFLSTGSSSSSTSVRSADFWASDSIRSLTQKAAAIESALLFPSSFIERLVSSSSSTSSSNAALEARAKLLSVRVGPYLAFIWGPMLLDLTAPSTTATTTSLQQQQQEQHQEAYQQLHPEQHFLLDPSSMCTSLFNCRLIVEGTLGLMPRVNEMPSSRLASVAREEMLKRTRHNKKQLVESLSMTITRRSRHVHFTISHQLGKLTKSKSFTSGKPRSPPPDASLIPPALIERKTSSTSGSTSAGSGSGSGGGENNNNDGEEAAADEELRRRLAKRPAQLFADIPELFSDDDDETSPITSSASSSSSPTTTAKTEEQKQKEKKGGTADHKKKLSNQAAADRDHDEDEEELNILGFIGQVGAKKYSSSSSPSVIPTASSLMMTKTSRGVQMVHKLKELLIAHKISDSTSASLTLKYLLPIQVYGLITCAVRRGVNLSSGAQVRSTGHKVFRESGLLLSNASMTRFVDALHRLDKQKRTGLAQVLAALDVQVGRGILESISAVEKWLVAVLKLKTDDEDDSNHHNSEAAGEQKKKLPVFNDLHSLVTLAAQIGFDTSFQIGQDEVNLASSMLLKNFTPSSVATAKNTNNNNNYYINRAHMMMKTDEERITSILGFSPAAIVVALQHASFRVHNSSSASASSLSPQRHKTYQEDEQENEGKENQQQQQQQEGEEEEEGKKQRKTSPSGFPPDHHQQHSPSPSLAPWKRNEKIPIKATTYRTALPRSVSAYSDSQCHGVCVMSNLYSYSHPSSRLVSRDLWGDGSHQQQQMDQEQIEKQQQQQQQQYNMMMNPQNQTSSSSSSSSSSSQFTSFPEFPLPGQFIRPRFLASKERADSATRRWRKYRLEAVFGKDQQNNNKKNDQPPPCAFDYVAPGLEIPGATSASASVKGTVADTSSEVTVEMAALRRQLRTSLRVMQLSEAVPAEVPIGSAAAAAKVLHTGAETVSGIRALRSLETDSTIKLASPSNVDQLRSVVYTSTEKKSDKNLSQPSCRQMDFAVSVLDERHRANRRCLRKIRRESAASEEYDG